MIELKEKKNNKKKDSNFYNKKHEKEFRNYEENKKLSMITSFENDLGFNENSKDRMVISEMSNKDDEKEKKLNNKYRNKMELFKKKFLDWGANSTAHGVSNIIRLDSKLLKIIWFACFLASFSYCTYTVVSVIINYLEYDVLINQEVVTEAPVDFPAVTVCNIYAFDKRHAQAFINETLEKNNLSYVSDITQININPTLINELLKSSILGNREFTKENITNMGFTIDYMLLTCYFNNVPCNESDFVWMYDYDYTNCYTFNSGYDIYGNKVPIRQVSEAGSDLGLQLELFIGYDPVQSQYVLNSGARVVVHNQSITPIINSEGIEIATGFQTNVGVTRSFLYQLDSPYSNCIKNVSSPDAYDSYYFKSIFNILNMTIYRQKICLRLCLQAFILSSCSCLDGSLPIIYNNSTVCQSLSTLECVSKARIAYYSNQTSSLCPECPLECDTTSFDITTSNSRYPTQYYQNYLAARTNILEKFPPNTSPDLTKTTVLLNVFYDDIDTTYTQEVPAFTPLSLLGNIGGNLGLFIGASLLTFVELVELTVEFLFICYKS